MRSDPLSHDDFWTLLGARPSTDKSWQTVYPEFYQVNGAQPVSGHKEEGGLGLPGLVQCLVIRKVRMTQERDHERLRNLSAEAMWRKVLQLRSSIGAIEYCSEVSWEGNEDGPLLSAVEVTGYCAQSFHSVVTRSFNSHFAGCQHLGSSCTSSTPPQDQEERHCLDSLTTQEPVFPAFPASRYLFSIQTY